MMFSLCLSCGEINVALDPVTSRVVHVRLRVIDHIYVSACLPSLVTSLRLHPFSPLASAHVIFGLIATNPSGVRL